jgi:hypothetical protein
MRKFKLIKEYPGSREVGTIVEKCSFTGSGVIGNNKLYTNKKGFGVESPENYPEYWEEVIEKDYEIISYVAKDNPTNITIKRRGAHLHEEYWTIHTVKRLSDGEVFTVGDRAKTITSNGRHTVTQLRIRQKCTGRDGKGGYNYDGIDRIWIDWEDDCGGNWLESTEKLKQPIFLTHDGKNIFVGDRIVWVNKDSLLHGTFTADYGSLFCSNQHVYFNSAVDAQDYIERNKPRLSIEDCFKILQKSFLYGNGFEKEIEKYIRKNNK